MANGEMDVPFNIPSLSGKEGLYVQDALASRRLAGNGPYTRRCQRFFEERYGLRKCLLTTSGTSALEMAALLTGVGPGDEVIVPSYTFVSSALAFARQGARIVFCDSGRDNPNLDATKIESLVTPRTKVIVPVHYAGVACDMEAVMAVATRHGLVVVEDAAQGLDSFHSGRPLGSIGHLGCFSFHETKGITCGEGGMLAVNDERFLRRSEIVWEKGTNRAEFFRGEVNKYGWVDTGGSFAPSEILAAVLWAQLESMDAVQARRMEIWHRYRTAFSNMPSGASFRLGEVPDAARPNAHMFYLLFDSLARRGGFIAGMKAEGIGCVAHFLPLHSSDYYRHLHDGRELPNAVRIADTICRLPLYSDLTNEQVDAVVEAARRILEEA